MAEPAVERWRQHGNIFLWRYPDESRNYPGWQCTADNAGSASILELLAIMHSGRWSSKKTIALAWPSTAVIAPGYSKDVKWRSPSAFTLNYPKDKVPDTFWEWEGDWDEPLLKIGRLKLEELATAFESIRQYGGDFCVHADDQRLHGIDFKKMSIWFW